MEDEDEDFSVVVPSPSNLRRRARRSLRRNSARDDLEEYLNGLANDDHITGVDGDLDLDLALGNPCGMLPVMEVYRMSCIRILALV